VNGQGAGVSPIIVPDSEPKADVLEEGGGDENQDVPLV
jgi:hypothetical protein